MDVDVLQRIRAKLYPNYLHGIEGAYIARIGGTWASAADPIDPAKHPVRFTFRALKPLRDLASHIEVLIEGVACQKASLLCWRIYDLWEKWQP